MAETEISTSPGATYQFGFALTTALGNETRYINLRKYVDRAPEVESVWAPIKHYLDPDPYRHWPGPLHSQKVLNHEARPIFDHWSTLDAVVVHAFQFHAYLSLYRKFRRHKPLLAIAQDYAPFRDLTLMRNYGHDVSDGWKRRTRFELERLATRQADIYLPWSNWAKRLLVEDSGIDPNLIHVVPPGIDLELWPFREPEPGAGTSRKVRLLFVGGDFRRKGGDTLMDAYRRGLADRVEIDVVTRQTPDSLPGGVRVHTGLGPNDPRLRELYARCDTFVLPTRADMFSIVILEAMATGRAVVATDVGGISDLVDAGTTGVLIPNDDVEALEHALADLLDNPRQLAAMGRAGRAAVEERLNADTTTRLLLDTLEEATDRRRGSRSSAGG